MTCQRKRIEVRGQVQGVGFRPYVYRLARECSLGGFVANTGHGAEIEVEGPAARVSAFAARLRAELPAAARVTSWVERPREVCGQSQFVIRASRSGAEPDAHVTPDLATCDACLAELITPSDRRFRYPFINCTNCGPRYSIVQSVPYDRPATTMRVFPMCPDCRREYGDPGDRRFHAQPNACPVCGPQVTLVDACRRPVPGDPFAAAARILRAGRIVAVKGIGGFHLACRADSQDAVLRLRDRKHRESKPLAVMVADLDMAGRCARLDPAAEALLTGSIRPIVLARPRDGSPLAAAVCPASPWVGLMLPYTPVHHLLVAEGLPPLVMTSGNPSDEPLTAANEEAFARLAGIADAYLYHNRKIARRVDDSVAVTYRGTTIPLRRARGYVPQPIPVPLRTAHPILAVGGEWKSTVCLLRRDEAVLSEHLGDLQNAATYRHFLGTIEQLGQLFECEPGVIAHDLHPAYLSTAYACGRALPRVAVQHHHAHVAAAMAEAGLPGPVIGIACDGTGYGTDGAVWGGELLVAEYDRFERVGHIRYFPLPGGDAAIRQPWRSAVSLLVATFGAGWRAAMPGGLAGVPAEEIEAVESMITAGVGCPSTSSLGRLFDAVSAIVGCRLENRHEAEAAMALEQLAHRAGGLLEPYPYEVVRTGGTAELDPRPMIAAIAGDVARRRPAEQVAARFHRTVATMLVQPAVEAAARRRIRHVVLSGGCFANRRLLDGVVRGVEQAGLAAVWHQRVPPTDGGLALGQAVVAAARQGAAVAAAQQERKTHVSGCPR